MRHTIRPLTEADEAILWEMLYQGLSAAGGETAPAREIVRRPEFARYVENWGREDDAGFVAHDADNHELLGAVWLRRCDHANKPPAPLELAFAVKPEHRGRGIGSALLTQLVRAHPEQSTISITLLAGKPVLRLYERFGFKVVEQTADAVIMKRDA